MFQIISEKIEVAGVYQNAHFIPKKIQWRKKIILIKEITLISDIRDGQVRKRMYSVMCGNELYRIIFNRDTEIWTLEEIWVK
jgi:hypothetical protein